MSAAADAGTERPYWVPADGAHYLHAQKTSRAPRRYVFVDTEAWRDQGVASELQRWRLGVSAAVHWRPGTKTWSPVRCARHETPEDLWETVSAFARQNSRTVVVGHNIGYDLRISRAFELLPSLGWTLGKLSLSGEHITLDLARDGCGLVIVDSLTVLRTSVKVLSEWRGQPKPALPPDDADEEDWWARCEADVATLAWAYLCVVDWMVTDDIGGWARTGSGMGWHTLLRRHLAERVLVHADPRLLEVEGQSCYAGRAEAWQPGDWTGTALAEWDYELAYAAVMEDEPLPCRYLDSVRGVDLPRMVKRTGEYAYLVHARAHQDAPVLPWRDRHGVCWPTGDLEGWWWHWELDEAVAHGAEVRVLEAHRYAAAPWLRSWAGWARSVVLEGGSPEAKVRSLVVKHWTRTIVGRSAMRFQDWTEMGPPFVGGVSYTRAVDYDTGKLGAILELGAQRFETWTESWWDSALPQVLSAVMAHVRVRLWRAMVTAGLSNVVYCDTDCLLSSAAGSDRLSAAVASGRLPGLRVKSTHDDLVVLAPQLVEGSSYRRLSGIPRSAVRVGGHTYASERWEGIASTLASEDPSVVRVSPLRQTLELVDWRRRHTGNFTSTPYVVTDGQREMPAGQARSGPVTGRPRALRPYQS